MSEIKLKPCPFCGCGVVMTKVIEDKFYVRALIYCPLCSVEMKSHRIRRGVRGVTKELIDESNLIARWWNRRVDNKPIRQSCKSCNYFTPDPGYRDGDMGNCRYLEKIWEKPFYVNQARAECEHFQAAERIHENGDET